LFTSFDFKLLLTLLIDFLDLVLLVLRQAVLLIILFLTVVVTANNEASLRQNFLELFLRDVELTRVLLLHKLIQQLSLRLRQVFQVQLNVVVIFSFVLLFFVDLLVALDLLA
jgi:hypothetical protein